MTMKRINIWQARWTFLKAAILLASILYLSALDELESLEKAVGTAMCGVLFLSILIPLRWDARRQQQWVRYESGTLIFEDGGRKEYRIDTKAVGGLTATDMELRLYDRAGKLLCRISRSNGNQETAGLDVIFALLDPVNGHRWDQRPFTIRRPKARRVRTVISILFWEAFVLFWGIFWQITGQMTPELLESWGALTVLLTLWSLRRWCKVVRCRIYLDREGIAIVPACRRKRTLPWGSFQLDWEKDGFPKLPGLSLTGWDQSLFKLLCALRDNGLLTDVWEVFHNV